MASIRAKAIFALAAAMFLGGCAVYRFSSPDHPSKIPPKTLAAASRNDGGRPLRFHVETICGTVFGGMAGRMSISADDLNACLATHWPALFDDGKTDESSLPITIEVGGELPFYSLGPPPGDIVVETGFLLLFGIIRGESEGEVTVKVLVDDALWSEKSGAKLRTNMAVCFQPLLFPVAYPLGLAIPPYASNWAADTHFGSLDQANTERSHKMACDLIAAAVLKAIAALSTDQVATIKGKAIRTDAQIASKKGLEAGAKTFETVGTEGRAVEFVKESHAFKADESQAARGIPEILEQRYDSLTGKGLVRANMRGCDDRAAYAYLTRQLIPAICETKNVVLEVDSPPPAHAKFRTLKEERKEDGSGILSIEFVAVE